MQTNHTINWKYVDALTSIINENRDVTLIAADLLIYSLTYVRTHKELYYYLKGRNGNDRVMYVVRTVVLPIARYISNDNPAIALKTFMDGRLLEKATKPYKESVRAMLKAVLSPITNRGFSDLALRFGMRDAIILYYSLYDIMKEPPRINHAKRRSVLHKEEIREAYKRELGIYP